MRDTTSGAAATRRPRAAIVILALGRPETAAVIARQGLVDGLPVVAAPVLQTEPGDLAAMDAAARRLAMGIYDGLCLTSAAAVDALAEAFRRTGTRPDVMGGLVVGSVGAGTTRRLQHLLGSVPTVVPDTATGRALGEAMGWGSLRLLLPQSDLASSHLLDVLETRGHRCDVVVAYRTVVADVLPDAARRILEGERARLVAATSPSCVRGWASLAPSAALTLPTVSIGPVTSRACQRYRLDVVAEAAPHDAAGVVATLSRVYPDLA